MANAAELIDQYLDGARALRAAVLGLDRQQFLSRPVPGKWSTLEVVCHLGDFEPVYADRMKRIIAMERPLLMGADENLFSARLCYHDRDPEEELALIEAVRRSMARILKTLPPGAFQRCGIHSERGVCTLEEMLTGAVAHIRHHLPFIVEKRRALGLPA